MQNYHWDLMTQFVFPEEYGIVVEVVSVDIKPRWQQIETDDSLRLVGIYHITSTVRFNPQELPEYSEGTLIEHLELNGNDGYFEYAFPLEVNLPKERVPITCNPELQVEDVTFLVYDGSNCTFKWNVNCLIEDPVDEPINEPFYRTVPGELENEPVYELNLHPEYQLDLEKVIEPPFERAVDTSYAPIVAPFSESIVENERDQFNEPFSEPIMETQPEAITESIIEPEHDTKSELTVELMTEPIVETSLEQSYESAYEAFESNSSSSDLDKLTVDVGTTYDDSYSNYTQQLDLEDDTVLQSQNLIDSNEDKEEIDYSGLPYDQDDFFLDLPESYTLLDLRSNKIVPE